MQKHHKLTPVSVLLWVVATSLLILFGFRLVRMAMGHATGIIRWLQVGAMALVGFILLALGSILDKLSQIVFYLENQNTVTTGHVRQPVANENGVPVDGSHLSSTELDYTPSETPGRSKR